MKRPPKLLAELLAGMVKIEEDIPIHSMTNDSRKVERGGLFIAYQGLRVDGRDYIKEAIIQGASAICFDPSGDFHFRRDPSIDSTIPIIPVVNLAEKQAIIAARFFNQPSAAMRVIGITGTNGKTSCSHFIAQGLQQLQQKAAVIGTLGYGSPYHLNTSEQTTPNAITLQEIFAELRDQGFKTVAMEVSSHALVQHRVYGIQFDIAVFTQLSRDHLDYHGDMQTYARAKELLFQHPGLRYAVINADDEWGQHLIKTHAPSLEVVTYSAQGEPHVRHPSVVAKSIRHQAQGFDVAVQTPWGEGEFHSHLLGTFNVSNLLAIIAVLGILQIPLREILSITSALKTVTGRMQFFGGVDDLPAVVVDYSHTPDALEKALTALRDHCHGDLWCVFGCGGDRDKGKRPQMGIIAETWSDYVIVTSDNPRSEDPLQIINDIRKGFSQLKPVYIEPDRATAIAQAIHSAKTNDVILIAGKGHENYQIIGNRILPFNDSKQVQNQLNLRKSGVRSIK